MEIGRDHHNYLGMRDDREGAFVSPRKRLMRDAREFENGSPSAKHRRMSSEHRLSTDSVGSSDRSSPYRAPHSPHRGAMSPAPALGAMSPKPKVNFSIDSIMGGGAGPTMPTRPTLTPSKHPLSHLRSPMPVTPTPTRPRPLASPPRSPPPSREAPPAAPFSPYLGYPGVHPLLSAAQDPRLAQLMAAGAAGADPRQQLTPGYPNPAAYALVNQYMAMAQAAQAAQAAAAASPLGSLLAASQASPALGSPLSAAASNLAAAAAAGQSSVWTPPVASQASSSITPSPTPPPQQTIPPPREFRAASPTPPSSSSSFVPPSSRPSDFLRHPPTSSSTSSKAPDIKYRGEPSRCSKLFGDNDGELNQNTYLNQKIKYLIFQMPP